MARPPEEPGAEVDPAARRRRRLTQAVALAALVVIAISFVVANSQPVKVHFWFVTAHPRLIWVIVACLLAGMLFGMALGNQRRRRRAARQERRRGGQ